VKSRGKCRGISQCLESGHPGLMFMVLSSITRVDPVHLMNADSAPGGRRPSETARVGRMGYYNLFAPDADTLLFYLNGMSI